MSCLSSVIYKEEEKGEKGRKMLGSGEGKREEVMIRQRREGRDRRKKEWLMEEAKKRGKRSGETEGGWDG